MKSRKGLHLELLSMLRDVESTSTSNERARHYGDRVLDQSLNTALLKVGELLRESAPRYLMRTVTIPIIQGTYDYQLPLDFVSIARLHVTGSPDRQFVSRDSWEDVTRSGGFTIADNLYLGRRRQYLRHWNVGPVFDNIVDLTLEYNYQPEVMSSSMNGMLEYTMTNGAPTGAFAIEDILGADDQNPPTAPYLGMSGIITELFGAISTAELGEPGRLRYRQRTSPNSYPTDFSTAVTAFTSGPSGAVALLTGKYDVGDVPPDLPDFLEPLLLYEAFCYAVRLYGEFGPTHQLELRELRKNANMRLQHIDQGPRVVRFRTSYNLGRGRY